jgi:hypothetical protein
MLFHGNDKADERKENKIECRQTKNLILNGNKIYT